MSNMKKKNNKKTIILMIVIFIFLVGIAISLLLKDKEENFTGSNGKESVSEKYENDDLYSVAKEEFNVKTSYGNIVFPERWKDYVQTKVVNEENAEIIQFWVSLGKGKETHIFDIVFGEKGYQVGRIKLDDGNNISVCVESYNTEFDENWTEEEKNLVISIGHDVNYLLENLTSISNYESLN